MGLVLFYPKKSVTTALRKVKELTGLHGRWDVISEKPMVVLDVAHNEDGIRQILEQLKLLEYDQLHIVTGMVKDKDASKVLSILPKTAKYYFTNASIPRALDANDLRDKASEYNLKGEAYPEVNQAFLSAKKAAGENDLVLVCGSVFIVGEINV